MRWATFSLLFVTFYFIQDIVFFFLQPLINTTALLVISWLTCSRIYRKLVLPNFTQRIEGKPELHVLITGCDTGFGFLTSQRLHELGFSVISCCLSKESDGAKKLSLLKNVHVLELDVCKEDDVKRVHEQVVDILSDNNNSVNSVNSKKKLHSVINNAGIALSGMIEWNKSTKDLEKTLDVNLVGVVRVSKAFLPLLRQSKGRIVNISSAAARETGLSMTSYCISKAGVTKFSESLDLEVASFGVKVVTLEPFFFKTPITEAKVHANNLKREWDEDADEEVKQSYKSIGRLINSSINITDSSFITDPNPLKVVHVLEEAVTSPDPDSFYRPGYRFPLSTISMVLPYEILFPLRRFLVSVIAITERNASFLFKNK